MSQTNEIIIALERHTGKKTSQQQQEQLKHLFTELDENLGKIKMEKTAKLLELQEKIKNSIDFPKHPLNVREDIRNFFIRIYTRAALDVIEKRDGIPLKICIELIEKLNKSTRMDEQC